MKMQDVLTRVKGKTVTVHDVVDYLKANGTFRNTIYQLIEMEVVELNAQLLNVSASEEEMESFCNDKRSMMGLSNSVDFQNYFRMNGIRWDQWRKVVGNELLRRKLKEKLIGEKEIVAFFESNRDQLKMVCLARIVVRDESVAENILERVRSGEEEFSSLARELSTENTSRIAGGYLGCFKRGMLPSHIEKVIFSGEVKGVYGPFSQNGLFTLYRVEEVLQAELSDALRSHISDKLFNQWLRQEVLNART